MRIGVDCFYMAFDGQEGFKEYLLQTLRHLPLGTEDELTLLAPASAVPALEIWMTRYELKFRLVTTEFRSDLFTNRLQREGSWYKTVLPKLVSRSDFDVLFCPTFFAPPNTGVPTLVTVHDLVFEHYPEMFPAEELPLYSGFGALSSRQAEGIIAVSYATARDVSSLWGIDSSGIRVVSPGFDIAFARPASPSALATAARTARSGQYCLWISPDHPRKNLARGLRAYANLPDDLRHAYPLVVVNGPHDEVASLARHCGIINSVVSIGRQDFDVLVALLRGARALFQPSLYEGFGLPAIQALAAGVPVVGSSAPCIPEVTLGACVYPDPLSSSSLTAAMELVLSDETARKDLIQRGLLAAQEYSWERSSRETMDYLRLVGEVN